MCYLSKWFNFTPVKKIRCSILILLLIGGIYFFGFVADGIDKKMNTVSNPHPLENLQQKVEPVLYGRPAL